jgi:hypothetical protein
MTTKTMTVSTAALDSLRTAYRRIIRAAKKIGVEIPVDGMTINWKTKRELKKVVQNVLKSEDGEHPDHPQEYLVEVVDVGLLLPEIGAQTGRWRVVGLVNRVVGEVANGENEVFSKDPEVVAFYRTATITCAHCKVNRYRVKSVVCQSTENIDRIQLGMECAVHYVGDAEKQIGELEFQEYVLNLIKCYEDGGESGGSGHSLYAIDSEDVVALTLKVCRDTGGYQPSTIKGRYEYDEPQRNPNATWRRVLELVPSLNPPKEIYLTDAERTGDQSRAKEAQAKWIATQPTDDDRKRARELITWINSVTPEPTDEFLINLQATFAPGWVSNRKLAFACCIEKSYMRAMAIAQEKANPPTAPAPEGRVEVEGTVLNTKTVENEFGVSFKMLVKLPTGAKVYCSIPSGLDARAGDVVRFKATFTRSETDQYFAFGKIPKLPSTPKEKKKKTVEPELELSQNN